MKKNQDNGFYKFIRFLNDIHILEYGFYIVMIEWVFYFYDKYSFSSSILFALCNIVIAMAFMNTWTLESKKVVKNEITKND